MPSAQRVRLTPASRAERWLLPLLLTAAWSLAGATVVMLYRDVWLPACGGKGVLCPVLVWYDRLTLSAMHALGGLCLAGFALALWWSLRPLRRAERWALALSAPAIALAMAAVVLLTRVGHAGQARAMRTFTAAMQPAVAAMDRGTLTDADLQAALSRMRAALPCLPRYRSVTIAVEPPQAQDAATLVVRGGGDWVAWDRGARTWLDDFALRQRLCPPGIVR
ncbi:MAG: hypothetical protein HZB16_01965 [Armatimonadetes bacterium]|nr:hypothetical protein [Armatimonadota bacterium]